jgi:hypothetical protein
MNTNTADNNHATIEFGTEPSSGNGGVGFIGSTVTASNLADLFFGTRTGASSFATHMTIKSGGDTRIGTSTNPYTLAQKLIVGDGDDNDGITIQSGTTHQGNLAFNKGDGTTAFGRISYQQDTNFMAFFVNNTETMRSTSAGKFVVGDTTALNGGGALGSFVFSGSQGVFISTVAQSTGEVMGFVHQKTSVVGTIAINSSSTSYNTSSDARLKDVTGEARGLDVINKLNPVSYNWKVDGKEDEGLIAQECEDIVPNAITKNSSDYYEMDYSKLVVHLVKGIQEQQEQIEQLKTEINNLH